MRSAFLAGMAVLAVGGMATSGAAVEEPGWAGQVLKTGPARDQVNALPIVERPYRPLHFYGNTVRRIHYRGRVLPAPRDLRRAARAWREAARP
jgi:hypothetical protein